MLCNIPLLLFKDTQVLCLSPTRKLAVQIQKVVLAMGYYLNIQCPVYIGGINIGEDMQKLDFGQHTASETSGHVFDMIKHKMLYIHNIKILVLDEAYEMFNNGFKEQMYDAYDFFPAPTQLLFEQKTKNTEVGSKINLI